MLLPVSEGPVEEHLEADIQLYRTYEIYIDWRYQRDGHALIPPCKCYEDLTFKFLIIILCVYSLLKNLDTPNTTLKM